MARAQAQWIVVLDLHPLLVDVVNWSCVKKFETGQRWSGFDLKVVRGVDH